MIANDKTFCQTYSWGGPGWIAGATSRATMQWLWVVRLQLIVQYLWSFCKFSFYWRLLEYINIIQHVYLFNSRKLESLFICVTLWHSPFCPFSLPGRDHFPVKTNWSTVLLLVVVKSSFLPLKSIISRVFGSTLVYAVFFLSLFKFIRKTADPHGFLRNQRKFHFFFEKFPASSETKAICPA